MDNVRRKHLSFRKTRIKMLVSDQVAETCDACDRTEDLRVLHFSSVPSMALILLVKVQSRVFTAKCSEPQVGTSNGMDEGSGVTKFLSLRTET